MERTIKRGDIFFAKLDPVVGSEQGGIRPALIISNDIGNKCSPTVVIAPITSKSQNKNFLPTHASIKELPRLNRESIVLLEQIRTIDKTRLRNYLGSLDDVDVILVNYAIVVSLGLSQ